MERIKDLSKVILRGDMILAEVKEERESGIILPDSAKEGYDYLLVIAVGSNVTDIKPGYIIYDADNASATYKIGEKKYARLSRMSLGIVVDPDNFNPANKKQSFSKIIK